MKRTVSSFGLPVIVCLSACALSAGCGGASFVQTDTAFVPVSASDPPEVFLDRLPGVSYRSVGIIEVESDGSLEEIVWAAQKKGQKVGCHLLVDRSIHGVSSVESSAERASAGLPLRRRHAREWTEAGAYEGPGARSAEAARAGCGSPETGLSSTLAFPRVCGGVYAAPLYVPPPTVAGARPVGRREFICGLYTDGPAQGDSSTADSTGPVWRSLLGSREKAATCKAIARLLKRDEGCSGEQCRPAIGLSLDFISNCSELDPDGAIEASRRRRAWRERAPAPAPDTCYSDFLNSVFSAQQAQTYVDTCLQNREPGHVERLVIRRAMRYGKKPVQAPPEQTPDNVEESNPGLQL